MCPHVAAQIGPTATVVTTIGHGEGDCHCGLDVAQLPVAGCSASVVHDAPQVASAEDVSQVASAEGVDGRSGGSDQQQDGVVSWQYCQAELDCDGLCHCRLQTYVPHVPFLPILPEQPFPQCRDKAARLLYIDDATVAEKVRLDRVCFPLLTTEGPFGQLQSCNLGIPGSYTQLQHRLRDIERQSKAVGMVLNTAKTKAIMFNFTHNRQAVPFISPTDGPQITNPVCLQIVRLCV